MITVYASIGNSDDKLTQFAWAHFAEEFVNVVSTSAEQVHGVWFSEPSERYQNACICFEIPTGEPVDLLKEALAAVAGRYQQDSIAWAEATTTAFIRGKSS